MAFAQHEFAQQAPASWELMYPQRLVWCPLVEFPYGFPALLPSLTIHFSSVLVGEQNHCNSLQVCLAP